MYSGILCILVSALLWPSAALSQEMTDRTRTQVIDSEQGRTLFIGQCGRCHGIKGEGGSGPSLTRSELINAPDLDALISVIRFGIGGTGMPGNWMITEREATQIAHYVQSLGKNAEEVILGDPVAGRTVFEKGYCAGCHIIQGAGRGLGPELSSVGTRRGAEYLRTIIRHPAGNSAKNLRGYKTFLIVQVETSDGNTVRGIRINEDTFTIQIRDKGGAYHSFRKRDVKNVSRAVDESLMPAYEKTFSPAEIDDLVAYLASLRGKK